MTTELARRQDWLQTAVTNSGAENASAIVAPSATLSGAARLAIYQRSYHARLRQCFQSMFPALLQALGEALFNAFALDYLTSHPPRSYTLEHLADDFPAHLARTRPPDETWPDFIIELASLELALHKIYDGPGAEGANLLSASEVLSLSGEQFTAARWQFVPCRQLFAWQYPVADYWRAARRRESPLLPAPAPSFALLLRRHYRLGLFDLTARQHAYLQALEKGKTPAAAVTVPNETARLWLSEWATQGLFLRPQPSS